MGVRRQQGAGQGEGFPRKNINPQIGFQASDSSYTLWRKRCWPISVIGPATNHPICTPEYPMFTTGPCKVFTADLPSVFLNVRQRDRFCVLVKAHAGRTCLRQARRSSGTGRRSSERIAVPHHREIAMLESKFLTPEEVAERYRGSISVGTLRNWRGMRIGPSFVKIGKAVLYPVDSLDAWDKSNVVTCRASPGRSVDRDDAAG